MISKFHILSGRLSMFAIGCALLFMSVPSPARAAYDPSSPYRNMPGFQCLGHGRDGVCMDFTYYGTGDRQGDRYDARYDARYDSRYDRRYDDDDGDRYARRRSRPVRPIAIRVTGSPRTVEPGDTLSYAVYVRNNDPFDRSVEVRAFLDPGTAFLSATTGGREIGNDEVVWPDLFLQGDSSTTLTLRVRVTGRYGTALRLRVQADGDEDVTTTRIATCDGYFYDGRYDGRFDGRYDDRYDGYDQYGNRIRRRRPFEDDCDFYDDGRRDRRIRPSLSVSDHPDPVGPGELLTYTIAVRGDPWVDARDLRVFLDPDTSFYSASEGGYWRAGEVGWYGLSSARGRSRILTLTVYVSARARDGDVLRLRVLADGREWEETTRVRSVYRILDRTYNDRYDRYNRYDRYDRNYRRY